jgi:hypothetical protein
MKSWMLTIAVPSVALPRESSGCEVNVPILNGQTVSFGRLEGLGNLTYSCGMNVSSAISQYYNGRERPEVIKTIHLQREYAKGFCRSEQAQAVIKNCR